MELIHLELSGIDSELGAIFNAFSLHETENSSLAAGIENVGQVMDASHLDSKSLVITSLYLINCMLLIYH